MEEENGPVPLIDPDSIEGYPDPSSYSEKKEIEYNL